MAASLTRLARSAPENPGVPRAMTVKALEPVPHPAVAKQGGSSQVLHSGQLLASDGGVIGRAYAYGGNPSWVFMSVRASGLSGTYGCELLLANGTTLRVGAVVVHGGAGDFAHPARVGASKVRYAMLVTATAR